MIDTMIYDELYSDRAMANKIIKFMDLGILRVFSTPIQKAEIEAIFKPEGKDKKDWCLRFYEKLEIVPSLFSFGIPGAGFGVAKWASQNEGELYKRVMLSGSSIKLHKDRNIAAVAAAAGIDMLITKDKRLLPTKLPGLRIINSDEFVSYLSQLT